jgi:aryl-phospho-beta-D-glucosidase BglC (GH1 family)
MTNDPAAPRWRWLFTAGLLAWGVIVSPAWLCCTSAQSDAPTTGNTPDLEGTTLPEATPELLPRWRGFNLLEKFYRRGDNGPFLEADFRLIHELGFNFVRLPMDYRVWIKEGDWTRFDEQQLRDIDQAVEWGKQYAIHVCINFHRAPGYTVASPPEETDLWTDPRTQAVCAQHWAMFARRYRGIPNAQLSFNLFNEPAGVSAEAYVAVVRKIAAAIRAEDPQRLIISDGLEWGRQPIAELDELRIAQATRGYTPMDVTHYKAGWVQGADRYAIPSWPRLRAGGSLYAPAKAGLSDEAKRPLVIEGEFPRDTPLRVRVNVVSSAATLFARADGQVVWEKAFTPGPGTGEWKEVHYDKQWNVYQNVYDRSYQAVIPAGTSRVELAVTRGDWMSLSEIAIGRPDGQEDRLALRSGWDQPVAQLKYDAARRPQAFLGDQAEDRAWLWETAVAPWAEARQRGIGVMVGEFGCYHKTPHDVTLAWMEDCLVNWRQAGMGWALWNFRGSFGVLDSDREDVQYEPFHGHQLDRRMLELLQRY